MMNCEQNIYTGRSKRKLLYRQLKDADRWVKAKDVDYMRGIYGHCAKLLDDFDDISYWSYTIWLIQHKKYKYVTDFELKEAYENMKLMYLKIPKSLKRKLRRLKKNGMV